MRNGRLSKREMNTVLRAQEILNAWIDYQEERGIDSDNDLAVNRACIAAAGIADFSIEYDSDGADGAM